MPKKNIDALVERLQNLNAQAAKVRQEISREKAGQPRVKTWMLINDLLFKGEKSTLDIAEILVREGHDLGKYPHRTVTSTVLHPALANIFKVRLDKSGAKHVALLEKKSTSAAGRRVLSPTRPSGRQARS